ncbi:carbohydrate porin [Flavicella marina]|uniref:carbohydrate porin n=1 Tax=Flavicella marina TaxID=1475951 RepID=UPI0012648128|nr:carbohydrate porin [Flavicella marina]
MKLFNFSTESKLLTLPFLLFSLIASSQIAYDHITNKNIAIGSYGRVGVDWSFDDGRTIGRRLNLNNMGSIGGRMEEQDYLEFAPSLQFKPQKGDSTYINMQLRLSVFSNSLTSFGNSTTSSLGGLTFAIPELFIQARNIRNSGINVWVGSRLYRGPDVHIADHFYFNDHSGQGFGIEFKKTRLAAIFVTATDTTSTVPPYFYLNIKTGTPSTALRQRTVLVAEHDIDINENNRVTLLGEYHRMPDGHAGDSQDNPTNPIEPATKYNYPSDYGFVIGARHHINLKKMREGSFNDLSVRYGTRIANGGDGGVSKTWATFGAPDTIAQNFKGAYSLAIVNQSVFNTSENNSINPYIIYTLSKGAAPTDGLSKTYFDREVYNKKIDFTIGARDEYYFNDFFHLITEFHYSQRKDGVNPIASMTKFTIAPVYVPTGQKSMWARPHIRFVASVAKYNDYAKESLYSPFLQFAGQKSWGTYFGVKTEWWLWN